MSNTYLKQLTDASDICTVGTKASNLALLAKEGFTVPLSFVIISHAYEHFIGRNRLAGKIKEIIDDEDVSCDEKSHRIKKLIDTAQIPAEIENELYNSQIINSNNTKWAVRSSATLEDLPAASFAGLYESHLNVTGSHAILESIKKCWSSQWGKRAMVYRQVHALQHEKSTMAVLIQKMVNAEYSGVVFTVNPAGGTPDEIVIEYCEGLGEKLVSGKVNPYRCTVKRSNKTVRFKGPIQRQDFGRSQIEYLGNLAIKIEKYLGSPQDIEWCFDGSDFYIIQARPISTEISSRAIPGDDIWTRANIGEVLPNVITPLSWDLFRATLLNDPEMIVDPSLDKSRLEGVKLFRGRAYLRLKGLMDSFCYLPAVNPEVMSQVLGVYLPELALPYRRPRGLLVTMAQAAFIVDLLGFSPRISRMAKRLSVPESVSVNRFSELLAWTIKCFRVHLKVTAYVIGTFGMISHLLHRWMPGEASTLLPKILTGHDHYQTAAQGIELWQIAQHAKSHSGLAHFIERSCWQDVSEGVSAIEGGSEFMALLQEFLQKNGERTAGEFELAVPRWREDPSFVLEIVRNYLKTPTENSPIAELEKRRQLGDSAIAAIIASLGPLRRWLFTRLLRSYRIYSTLRENVKYRLMEGYSLLRQLFIALGNDLSDEGALDDPGDIFYLIPGEVLSLINKRSSGGEKREVILLRRAERVEWESEPVPSLLLGENDGHLSINGDSLTGIGCSPGTAKGAARILHDISEANTLIPGEILVTPHTDPGWTPLFLSCKAVVTEIGGFLSHGATVAREYGIPAVVSVPEVTSKLKTGDVIEVNGDLGIITVCAGGKNSLK